MDELGEENRIPIINVDEGDVYVLFGFPIAGLLLAGLVGSDTLVLPFVLTGIVLGVAAVYASPSHLAASTWLADVYRYYCKRPRFTYSAPDHAATDEATDATHNEGGLINYTPFTPDERTQDLTNIERAWPGAGTIQRTDRTMEAFLEVDPGNMDFAMSGDWAHVQEVAGEFANKELDYSLKFHATTRSFPVENLITQIDARLGDEDVANNPVFQELLTEYREQRPRELEGTQQIRYFIGVQVTPMDVYNRYRDEQLWEIDTLVVGAVLEHRPNDPHGRLEGGIGVKPDDCCLGLWYPNADGRPTDPLPEVFECRRRVSDRVEPVVLVTLAVDVRLGIAIVGHGSSNSLNNGSSSRTSSSRTWTRCTARSPASFTQSRSLTETSPS